MEKRKKEKKNVFTIKNFVKRVVWRQRKKEADTFIIIYGARRTGKTNLGFKILIEYLHAMRKEYKEGNSRWNPPNSWKKLFSDHFAVDAEDMIKKIKHNAEKSFTFIDEGDDVVSWQHAMEKEQKDLNELILKTGKKKMLTILIVPSVSLLQKTMLSNAQYLFIIPSEPQGDKNSAYLFRNYENPILREKLPFGLKKIEDDLLKNKHLSEKKRFHKYLRKKDRFITVFNFRPIREDIYALYDKVVKDPIIMRERNKRRMVSLEKYRRGMYILDTLLYNLKNRDGKNIKQIESLMRDKFGTSLASASLISNHITKITTMLQRPKDVCAEEFFETDNASTEDIVCDVDASEEGNEGEEEINAS